MRRRLRNVVASGEPLADYEEVPVDFPPPILRFAAVAMDLPTRSPLAEVYEKAPEQLVEAEHALAKLSRSGAGEQALAAAFQRVVRLQLRADRMKRYTGKQTLPVESFASAWEIRPSSPSPGNRTLESVSTSRRRHRSPAGRYSPVMLVAT